MPVKYRSEGINIPRGMGKSLEDYLEDDEEVVDIINETYVPNFDIRWLILTSLRVVHATLNWFAYQFHEIKLEGMDVEFQEGIFYDTLILTRRTDQYRASFYSLNRGRTKRFLEEIENEKESFEYETKIRDKKLDHQAMEELIKKHVLPPEQDVGHEKKLEEEMAQEEKGVQGQDAVKALKDLQQLKESGAITEEEYEQKKKELLGRL